MDTTTIMQYGVGIGTLLAGVGIGVKKLVDGVKQRNGARLDKPICVLHGDLTRHVEQTGEQIAAVKEDISWIRGRMEEGHRQQAEENKWNAVISELKEIRNRQ